MNSFSDVFKHLRIRDGLSQRELAKKLKMSPSAVGMYESGQRFPSREAEEQIADFFNVTIDFLRGKDEETVPIESDYVRKFSSMSEEMQRRLLAYASFLMTEEKEDSLK